MLCRTCGGDGQIALTRCGLIMASRATGSIIATERCDDCDGDGWLPWPWTAEVHEDDEDPDADAATDEEAATDEAATDEEGGGGGEDDEDD